jgi:tetratricopeptide (TPR) repeat protein
MKPRTVWAWMAAAVLASSPASGFAEEPAWTKALAAGKKAFEAKRYAEAEPHLREALAAMEATDVRDGRLADCLEPLSTSVAWLGRTLEADPLGRRALAIREASSTRDEPALARSLDSLTLILFSEGRYDEGEPLARRALATQERVLPSDHLDIARTVSNLGTLMMRRGRADEAEALYRRAISIREKAITPEHPADLRFAIDLSDLAICLANQDKFDQVRALAERSLAIWKLSSAPDDPDIEGALTLWQRSTNMRGELTRLTQRSADLCRSWRRRSGHRTLDSLTFSVTSPAFTGDKGDDLKP